MNKFYEQFKTVKELRQAFGLTYKPEPVSEKICGCCGIELERPRSESGFIDKFCERCASRVRLVCEQCFNGNEPCEHCILWVGIPTLYFIKRNKEKKDRNVAEYVKNRLAYETELLRLGLKDE